MKLNYFNKKSEEEKAKKEAYKQTFLRKTDLKSNNVKRVNIRPEYHRIIQKIIQTTGESTILDYIDNVLSKHMQENKEIIRQVYSESLDNDPFTSGKK